MISTNRRKRAPATDIPLSIPAKKRGPKPRVVIEFPKPSSTTWTDCDLFHEALAMHMERHNESVWHLHKSVVGSKEKLDRRTIATWVAGVKLPRSVASLEILRRIERRYGLPLGYFAAKLPQTGQAPRGHVKLGDMTAAERRRFAWHLPDNFDQRPRKERQEILEWVNRVIVSGATEYRRFQALAIRDRYALRFPDLSGVSQRHHLGEDDFDSAETELVSAARDAPAGLASEVASRRRIRTNAAKA